MLAFDVKDLSLRIDAKQILQDISFTLAEGQSLVIVGANGAGKTSLLKCLGRMIQGSQGRVMLYGQPLESFSQRELAKIVSYVPQADGRPLAFSVEEFVLMARYPHLNPFSHFTQMDRAAARRAMECTDTAVFAQRAMNTLSGGERQRVFIAAAVAQGAQTLLLDEPTTFLDYRHQAEVLDLLHRLNRDEGLTVVAVMHDVNHGARACGRVLALKDGRMTFSGDAPQLVDSAVLESIYDTPFDILTHPVSGQTLAAPSLAKGAT